MNCVTCGSTHHHVWGRAKGCVLVQCSICGTIRVNDLDDRYAEMYSGGEYHAAGSPDMRHVDAGRAPHRERYEHDLNVARMRILKLIMHGPLPKPKSPLLDVGCANGAFMAAAEERGWLAYGIDLNTDAVVMPERFPDRIFCGDLTETDFHGERFDWITFNDSLEHMLNPREELAAAYALMRPQGTLAVEIPDMGSLEAIIEREHFHHIKPSEHLWYWTASQLGMLLYAVGFTLKTIDYPIRGKATIYAVRT